MPAVSTHLERPEAKGTPEIQRISERRDFHTSTTYARFGGAHSEKSASN